MNVDNKFYSVFSFILTCYVYTIINRYFKTVSIKCACMYLFGHIFPIAPIMPDPVPLL